MEDEIPGEPQPNDTANSSASSIVAVEKNPIIGQHDQALPSAVTSAIRPPINNDVSFSGVRQQFASASLTPVTLKPDHLTTSSSLDHLQGIEPIAEALLKTLAGKARTGRLSELKALELLRQAVLL